MLGGSAVKVLAVWGRLEAYLLGCPALPVRSCIVVHERNERKNSSAKPKSQPRTPRHVMFGDRKRFFIIQ